MASTDTVLALYSAAGLCECAGVLITIIDLRRKNRVADDVRGPLPPATSPMQSKARNLAASQGQLSYEQAQRAVEAFVRSLHSGWLLFASFLLLAGVVLGTIGNALGTG